MGVKVTTSKNLLPQMIQKAKEIDGKKVVVGSFGDHAWLAGIHEFGCVIPVTGKMRGFLGTHGIHLKKETTQIVIPERSFLRAGFDKSQQQLLRFVDNTLMKTLLSNRPAVEFLDGIGNTLASLIYDYAATLSSPPKSEASYKLGSDPGKGLLTDTGRLLDNITYRIEDD